MIEEAPRVGDDSQALELSEKIRNVNSSLDDFEPAVAISLKTPKQAAVSLGKAPAEPQPPPETIVDISVAQDGEGSFEIQTNVGERLVLKGKNISRFLVIQPNVLKASKQGMDALSVEPLEAGNTYMHLWDEGERKTIKFQIGPRKFEEELFRAYEAKIAEANLPEPFKVSYSIEGDSFMTGRGIGDLQRKSHILTYSSSVIGETPYGRFDTSVQASRTQLREYHVSNFRMGLTGAHYDEFKDINMRFFDFTPAIQSFGFPTSDLRGAMVEAPMFDKRLNYTAFWGAIPTGNFTQLPATSGLDRTKEAWLEGLAVNYKPWDFANYKTFFVRSYGPERTSPVRTNEAQGFGMSYDFGRFNFGSEMVQDPHNISYTANSSLTFSKVRVGLSMTENNKDFASVLGGEPSSGSTSGTLTTTYRPTQDVTISNAFSGTRDKVFGNPDRPARPNYNSTTRVNWTADPHTEYELGYTMDDQIGSNSPSVTETKEAVIRKRVFLFRRLGTFLSYQNRKMKNYSSPAQDFNNNRLLGGLSFRVLGDLYAYYHREFNYLRNNFTNETAFPMAQEFGLNIYRQIGQSPFYTNSRLFYRDEEQTESVLSFLSGEDRLEAESELTFKPNPDTEAFFKVRLANIWAEKDGVNKHMDFDFSWGLRLIWDTGLRWHSVGGFYGYCFYDINGDGVKQGNEHGVKAVEIMGPQGQKATTDGRGYYKIAGLKGKTAFLELDVKTVPKGYNSTTPARRELNIVHGRNKRVDFGIATRTEVSGLIFYDKNNNGLYDSGDEPAKGVVVVLDDTSKAASSIMGEYMIRKIPAGDHTIKLDLKTIPVEFIPKVPISKTIRVIEGTTFVYNIPLASVPQAAPKASAPQTPAPQTQKPQK